MLIPRYSYYKIRKILRNFKDTRHRAQKWNVGPEQRKGLETSRADVSGNARHFCDDEFNYKLCESF